MKYYLNELNLDINQLQFVHVTGSKGKGTCCTYVESALRKHGLKTGFFSSPHLQNLCERFRINGKCISKVTYLKHFNVVWSTLQKVKQNKVGRNKDSSTESSCIYCQLAGFLPVSDSYCFPLVP